ncbi:MAG: hypothetical protein JO269_09155 [Burkholderiaceae bacterium]|nr:hypothetical protein [Burkholderiaceae bacterium]
MSAISLNTATQSPASNGSLQSALQQAKRIANQAESSAQSLEAQAQSAQAEAASAQDYASSLTIQADQAQLSVGWTQQDVTALETAKELSTQITSVINNVVSTEPARPALVVAPIPPPPVTHPVLNTQGQVTGKIINTSA